MSAAPIFAEGRPAFESRAGGDFVIANFPNGATIMLSRHDAFALGRDLVSEAYDTFTKQTAQIVKFHNGAGQ